MSWAGIANNQTVSFANLKDAVDNGIFYSKQTQSTSNEQITKTDAGNYVYLNESYSPYANKASNQLVVKSNLVPRCWCWKVTNDDSVTRNVTFVPCGTSDPVTIPIFCCGDFLRLCSKSIPTADSFFVTIDICGSSGVATQCITEDDCYGCEYCGSPCDGSPSE